MNRMQCVKTLTALLTGATLLTGCYTKRIEKTSIQQPSAEEHHIVIENRSAPERRIIERKTTVIEHESR